jgi:transcriptional regulator with XRE-family HTH domain
MATKKYLADLPSGVSGPEILRPTAQVPGDVDVRAIRTRLGMTRAKFAETFGFPPGTLENWERRHRRPEGAARALLMVIDRAPDEVIEALSAKGGSLRDYEVNVAERTARHKAIGASVTFYEYPADALHPFFGRFGPATVRLGRDGEMLTRNQIHLAAIAFNSVAAGSGDNQT